MSRYVRLSYLISVASTLRLSHSKAFITSGAGCVSEDARLHDLVVSTHPWSIPDFNIVEVGSVLEGEGFLDSINDLGSSLEHLWNGVQGDREGWVLNVHEFDGFQEDLSGVRINGSWVDIDDATDWDSYEKLNDSVCCNQERFVTGAGNSEGKSESDKEGSHVKFFGIIGIIKLSTHSVLKVSSTHEPDSDQIKKLNERVYNRVLHVFPEVRQIELVVN